MPIPESQLDTWSNPGAITTAKATHESIRSAIDSHKWPDNIEYDTYLQGSYKNSTNIRGDSDVDLVVELKSTFQYDLSKLAQPQRELFGQSYPDAKYTWDNFRSDILSTLRNYYGNTGVTEGNKSIKIAGAQGRLAADVVVCLEYKQYLRFQSLSDWEYIPGIVFYTLRDRRRVINYPRPHYDNGTAKNTATTQWYKPTVRIFKNARTYMVDHGLLPANTAPSYFLECLIYNIPNSNFGISYKQTFTRCINSLQAAALGNTLHNFACQNGQQPLFGTTPEQWNLTDARQTIGALISLWNNWS